MEQTRKQEAERQPKEKPLPVLFALSRVYCSRARDCMLYLCVLFFLGVCVCVVFIELFGSGGVCFLLSAIASLLRLPWLNLALFCRLTNASPWLGSSLLALSLSLSLSHTHFLPLFFLVLPTLYSSIWTLQSALFKRLNHSICLI